MVARVLMSDLCTVCQLRHEGRLEPASRTGLMYCRYLHMGRVYIMAGLTYSANFNARKRLCRGVLDPGNKLPPTL